MNYLLGYDIGSSSIKAALLDADSGKPIATAHSPADEMRINSPDRGFAEQDPESWWAELIHATALLKMKSSFQASEILAIGISYQMHGLVCVNKQGHPVRPAIIWCDGRAVDIGKKAFQDLGEQFCLSHYLNSPGNFTASKLRWVYEQEPAVYQNIYKFMLPGDYIAYKLTGQLATTVSGLSEAILWDYRNQSVAKEILDYYQVDSSLLPELVPTFGEQGRLHKTAAGVLGLPVGIPVSYRAGDQPNNAFSVNVLKPGQIAATAGTSGVVYGVTEHEQYDPLSRVNSFVHVNHLPDRKRYGVLLCVNGTGILNSWLRKQFFSDSSYDTLNREAAAVPVGSEGLSFYPFGNGAERILENRDPGAGLKGLQFNRHHRGHVARAAQEGIVFALQYGMEIMETMGMDIEQVRAGHANMFLSTVFSSTFANALGCSVELFNTDGALGAARGAGLGLGWFDKPEECFRGMHLVSRIEPEKYVSEQTAEAYRLWKKNLEIIS